ncbi:MAG TPA: transcription elongation factor GreA [Chloroflexota bacterium]|jgi:transcription elongation factor GreA|nr:transcription elongation factor GreA [Chloroflexota bacterium]
MHDKPVFLTPEGRAKLEAELKHLREVRRPEVAERIRAAKEFGDTVDNAEYEEAKNEQAFVEGRILTIEKMLSHAVAITADHQDHDSVRLGSCVTVTTEEGETERYTIVGSAEADPRSGKISNESPVGRALLGKRIGDVVEVNIPAGSLRLRISAIN